MKNSRLKYQGYSIVFQEVPNETSLAINISGCPHRCEGCHSKELWEYEGNYVVDDIFELIYKYQDHITCVCFMGGDQNLIDLMLLCDVVHSHGLKTCLYTGSDFTDRLYRFAVDNLDYIKVGKYDESRGGLTNTNTNQIFYKYTKCGFKDITSEFWKKTIEE